MFPSKPPFMEDSPTPCFIAGGYMYSVNIPYVHIYIIYIYRLFTMILRYIYIYVCVCMYIAYICCTWGSMMRRKFHQQSGRHVWFVASIFDCIIKTRHCKVVFSNFVQVGTALRIINGFSGTEAFPWRSDFPASNPFCKFCISEGKCSRHSDGQANRAEAEKNTWKT